jgi:hypothetical protein
LNVTRHRALLIAGCIITGPALRAPAFAQVGHTPAASPYIDLEHSQSLTLIGGQYHAHRDPADVGPQSGFLTGLHYEWRAGGPAHLTGEVARISSDRNLIDPAKPEPARQLGTGSRPLYSFDAGLGLSLTGAKSWHNIVPELEGGLGIVSDFRSQADSGGFKFGTRFAFTWGLGVQYVPRGRWASRADFKNRMYQLGYPQTYYLEPTGGTPVVQATQAKSFWLNNPAFTLGLSRLF